MSGLTSAFAVGIGTILLANMGYAGSSRGLRIRSVPSDSCSVEALGRAAAVDTARLRRVKRDAAPAESAEGGETTIYYQGVRPRVIVISYYGETGQTVVRYYLAAADQFVVQQEVLEYAEPISSRAQPVIASRLPSTLYVCGETTKDPVSQEDFARIRSDLRSVLAQPGRSR